MMKKNAWLATTALIGGLGFAGAAMAQSTASQQVEQVVVTAAGQKNIEGVIVNETAPRARASINQEFIATQAVGQTVLQSLNLVPGLNFTNNDPYGSSGGNIRLRGFDGARVSLTWDGVPLNDTGNYAVYTNQLLDPEIIAQTNVNQGTTEIDSPTASAAGGTINVVTRRPSADPELMVSLSGGSFDYKRAFTMVDTGAFGPFDTSFFIAGSYQKYDKWRGYGTLEKTQVNARIYQPLRGDDFVSVGFHYNINRNNNYRALTMADYLANGREFEFDRTCPVAVMTPGTAGSDVSCSNYYKRQVNPSNTGNIRGNSSFTLADGLRLTVDPSFQYTLADGGSQIGTLSERDGRARGASSAVGVDFNGDGDTLDTVRFFTPSVTNTRRYGLTSSLIYELNEHHRLRASYTLDYGRHRQTGEYTYLTNTGETLDVFGGKDGHGPRVLTADNSYLRGRDRFSIAKLQQAAAEYRGQFLDNRLQVVVGVRSPWFTRELNQFCYSQNGSSNVLCTTQVPAATLPNGNVTFAGSTTQYIAPYQLTKKYHKVLPNAGASYDIGGGSSVYISYAEGLSAPRTDNLYTVVRLGNGSISTPLVAPETTRAYDLGYRYSRGPVVASATVWKIDFKNRIQSAYDEVLGVNVDRNIGDVKQWGVDAQIGVQPIESLTLYASASYNNSEVKDDLRLNATQFLPIKGKKLAETPDWTLSGRVEWSPIEQIQLGVDAKWVDDRFATDVNDEVAPGYTVVNADIRYDLPKIMGVEGAFLQLNVINLFDEDYLGSISSRTNAIALPGSSASAPTYQPGAPRTVQVSLQARF